tara:strand:+ start:3551 stop:4507 length:957 start_codon:yes stop_codon:yes gene_type:complete
MATAPIYCTHKELKRVFPQMDEFDQKTALYGWVEVSTNKYAAHDSGVVTQLFADGEDLGPAQSAHTDLNVEGEWFYNSAEDVCYYYSASTPLDKLMEGGEEFTAMVTQFRTDASRFLDSRLDPNLPKEQLKDKSGNFDYMIIRTTALIAANFMIRTNNPTSEMGIAFMEEAEKNITDMNNGNAALSWQNTSDGSKGVIRDVRYDGTVRPVDTRGRYSGTYDLIKIKITTGGPIGTAKYSVWAKDGDKLGMNEGTQVITDEIVNGDYQSVAGGLQIRFAGTNFDSTAAVNDIWEIEVSGFAEEVDSSSLKPIRMTRRWQ